MGKTEDLNAKLPNPNKSCPSLRASKIIWMRIRRIGSERNSYAIDRLIERFGESYPRAELKVPRIRHIATIVFKRAKVQQLTSVLSGIFYGSGGVGCS
jgi:hypothetical protein